MLIGCVLSLSQNAPACVFMATMPTPALAASAMAAFELGDVGLPEVIAVRTTS